MLNLIKKFITSALIVTNVLFLNSCVVNDAGVRSSSNEVNPSNVETASDSQYSWTKVTDSAAFPGAYNFSVFVVHNQMWAFHPQGNWFSTDSKTWIKSEMPLAGLNSGYQKYVQLGDAVYALGTMTGDYANMRLSSRIVKTVDFNRWEIVAEESELPNRVFYGTAVFGGKIWLLGGYDGKNYYNDVWNSSDAVHWTRISEHATWSPRRFGNVAVFNNRLWVIGGGVIDGEPTNNPKSDHEVWSSIDGSEWTLVTDRAQLKGGTPIVFDGKLWLVGANRDGDFARSSMVTSDGMTWREESAPWSPRGAVAAWLFNSKLYITGGKYSVTENGQVRYIYSNDVWYMTAPQTTARLHLARHRTSHSTGARIALLSSRTCP